MKSARRPGEPISEGHIQWIIASLGGTFNICPITIFKSRVSAFRISQLELDPMDSPLCVRLCVNKRELNCGGATIRNRAIAGGAAGRKVGGTSEIESYGIVTRSVQKMFKIIPIYSDHWEKIMGRFLKNIKGQKQRPLFTAPRRRRVELVPLLKIMASEIQTTR